jgi:hypothetical protein
MTLEPDDPRLTAFLQGELSAAERAALEAQLQASESLREVVAQLRQTGEGLAAELAREPCPRLLPGQRETVLEAIRTASTTTGTSAQGVWSAVFTSLSWGSWWAWWALAGFAVAITAAAVAWQAWRPEQNQPVDAPAVASKDDSARGDDRQAAVRPREAGVAAGGSGTSSGLPLISLRVGEQKILKVFGQLPEDREVAIAAERLQWETDQLDLYAEFDPQRFTLRGLQPTAAPVLLTVRLNGLSARVRVEVLAPAESEE